jgi:hypothetical protein
MTMYLDLNIVPFCSLDHPEPMRVPNRRIEHVCRMHCSRQGQERTGAKWIRHAGLSHMQTTSSPSGGVPQPNAEFR